MNIIEGKMSAAELKLAITVSRFNAFVTDRLLEGALAAIVACGGDTTSIPVVKVPGAFELPLAAKKLATTNRYDGVICLGAVIRGETPHFEYISSAAANGVVQTSLETGVPIGFGVITAESVEQAVARAGTNGANKGEEAARAVIELANALRLI